MVPFADPVIISLLANHPDLLPRHGGRVSVESLDPLPSLRVTNVGDTGAGSYWGTSPVFQVEAWDYDPIAAGEMANLIANTMPEIRQVQVEGAFVVGVWIESNPRPLPDPDTDYFRYVLEVGLLLTPL